MIIDAVLLGLSSGSFCVMYCAPVLIPWFFSRKIETPGHNAFQLAAYLGGRLCGYTAIGVIAAAAGSFAAGYLPVAVEQTAAGISQTLAGVLLVLSGIFSINGHCRRSGAFASSAGGAVSLGFLSGFRMCPPLFAAAARVFSGNTGMPGGAIFFVLFFIFSSVYFTPLLLIYRFRKAPEYFRFFARVLSIMMGVYFTAVLGLPALFTGLKALR